MRIFALILLLSLVAFAWADFKITGSTSDIATAFNCHVDQFDASTQVHALEHYSSSTGPGMNLALVSTGCTKVYVHLHVTKPQGSYFGGELEVSGHPFTVRLRNFKGATSADEKENVPEEAAKLLYKTVKVFLCTRKPNGDLPYANWRASLDTINPEVGESFKLVDFKTSSQSGVGYDCWTEEERREQLETVRKEQERVQKQLDMERDVNVFENLLRDALATVKAQKDKIKRDNAVKTLGKTYNVTPAKINTVQQALAGMTLEQKHSYIAGLKRGKNTLAFDESEFEEEDEEDDFVLEFDWTK